jgi:hypothetical protein
MAGKFDSTCVMEGDEWNSSADTLGLVPYGDFVIAWSGGPLHSENDFYSLVESHVDKALRLFVYNSDLEYVFSYTIPQAIDEIKWLTNSNLREVVLYPTRQWGGEGLIGCGIG